MPRKALRPWRRSALDRTLPSVLHLPGMTVFTERVPQIETRASMPSDEFRHLRRILRKKRDAVVADAHGSHILVLAEDLILCV